MPTILIADDAGLFLALETSPSLRSACRLVTVRSAGELLARASTDSPDLFMLDADQFGSAAAKDCIRLLKADRLLAGIPIVIAARDTALFQPLLGRRDRAFAKPLQTDEVGAALKTILPLARRTSPRIPVSVPVICLVDESTTVRARSKDLASGGLFLRTPWEPPCGTRFRADFTLPEGEEVAGISALCEVVRLVGQGEPDLIAGIGAAIIEISDSDAMRLRRFVGSSA
jgi:CheY-like chemotaxis protein